jgi:NTE family protein
MGAVVAVAYSAGGNLKYLTQIAEGINWERLFDLRFPGLGLISGKHIISLVKLLSKNKKLEELEPPVWVIATDLLTGDEVIFKTGDVELAVRSSISIPGVFTPVKHGERLLVDGGVVAGVPVKAARQIGAELVIAVNVSFGPNPSPPKNFVDILLKTMDVMGSKLNQNQVREADLVIAPEVHDVGTGHFHRVADCLRRGEEAANRCLPKIRALIDKFSSGQFITAPLSTKRSGIERPGTGQIGLDGHGLAAEEYPVGSFLGEEFNSYTEAARVVPGQVTS